MRESSGQSRQIHVHHHHRQPINSTENSKQDQDDVTSDHLEVDDLQRPESRGADSETDSFSEPGPSCYSPAVVSTSESESSRGASPQPRDSSPTPH